MNYSVICIFNEVSTFSKSIIDWIVGKHSESLLETSGKIWGSTISLRLNSNSGHLVTKGWLTLGSGTLSKLVTSWLLHMASPAPLLIAEALSCLWHKPTLYMLFFMHDHFYLWPHAPTSMLTIFWLNTAFQMITYSWRNTYVIQWLWCWFYSRCWKKVKARFLLPL